MSVVLCLVTFVDPALLQKIGIDPDFARFTLGVCGAAVFLVSLVQLRVDWKALASEHQSAVEKLANAKALYRRTKHELMSMEDGGAAHLARALQEGDGLVNHITPIPDREFVTLKALHGRKVMVSRVLDRFPGAGVRTIRWSLWWRHTLAALRHRDTDQRPEQ